MQEDNELMELCKSGDKLAFEKLVIKHREASIFFANSFVKDIDVCEDIVQECFIKLYINRHLYKPTHSFKTYLYTLVSNKAIDHLRSAVWRQPLELDDTYRAPPLQSEPNEILDNKEKHILLNVVLESLQGDQKTALYLYSAEEMSYKEIAEIMHKTLPQVKIIIYRARKKLSKEYNNLKGESE